MNDEAQLAGWLDGILAQIAPASRRALARQLGAAMRAKQQARLAAQQNPDGEAFAPRKPQLKAGRIRRRAMFAKLRTAKYLKVRASPESAVVEFTGAVQRIAQVHHDGLRDRVNRRGLTVKYAERKLLGIAPADEAALSELVLGHLARK
jgi:phage virion morphogenesis protein